MEGTKDAHSNNASAYFIAGHVVPIQCIKVQTGTIKQMCIKPTLHLIITWVVTIEAFQEDDKHGWIAVTTILLLILMLILVSIQVFKVSIPSYKKIKWVCLIWDASIILAIYLPLDQANDRSMADQRYTFQMAVPCKQPLSANYTSIMYLPKQNAPTCILRMNQEP
eukprot:2166959-Ditylum_brightwellii.AAC.1